jgi:micrococcal nuclease
MIKGLLIVILSVLWGGGALAAGGLSDGETRRVAGVVDGDTVVLAEPVDGAREVRLVGIQAPKLPLGRAGFPTWPLAEAAKRFLEGLVQGREVRLGYGGQRVDRSKRRLAQLHRDDGLWVQGEMLRAGMARVYTFADNRSLAAEMLALEEEARAAGRGIWADPFYAVRGAEAAGGDVDSFQLVEGRVYDASRVKTRVYLNFGSDWRSDFTAALDSKAQRLFAQAGIDPLAYRGRTVRIRGWLRSVNGPLIDVSHPEQIELLNRS